jgi:hypothetical protein
MTASKELWDRLRRLETGSDEDKWFGFHFPAPLYDQRRYDIFENDAWGWFCLMQMNQSEMDEYVRHSLWQSDNRYPGTCVDDSPDLVEQSDKIRASQHKLERIAQTRAEELYKNEPEAYLTWKQAYKPVEPSIKKLPLSADPKVGMRDYWDLTMRIISLYRQNEPQLRAARTQTV